MKVIVKQVYNVHITDSLGITISDNFIVKYRSGIIRKFNSRNRISKNVSSFIKDHANTSISESITDKNNVTHTSIIWK